MLRPRVVERAAAITMAEIPPHPRSDRLLAPRTHHDLAPIDPALPHLPQPLMMRPVPTRRPLPHRHPTPVRAIPLMLDTRPIHTRARRILTAPIREIRHKPTH